MHIQYLFSLKKPVRRAIRFLFCRCCCRWLGLFVLVVAHKKESNKQNKSNDNKMYIISVNGIFFWAICTCMTRKWLNEILCMKTIYRFACKWNRNSIMCAGVNIEIFYLMQKQRFAQSFFLVMQSSLYQIWVNFAVTYL